jgi:hypothetical protein
MAVPLVQEMLDRWAMIWHVLAKVFAEQGIEADNGLPIGNWVSPISQWGLLRVTFPQGETGRAITIETDGGQELGCILVDFDDWRLTRILVDHAQRDFCPLSDTCQLIDLRPTAPVVDRPMPLPYKAPEDPEKQREHERWAAKIQFWERLIKRGVLVMVLVGVYFALGLIPRDKVLARKKIYGQTIIVRELPNAPIWLWPLEWIEDTPIYRFEYWSGWRMRSCQSGNAGESTAARSAEIKVNEKNDITVFLDGSPCFILRGEKWSPITEAY